MQITTARRPRRMAVLVGFLGTVSCLAAAGFSATSAQTARPAGWTEATHGAAVKPDYARLFSTNHVHEIRIAITPERHKAMQEDLTAIMPAGRMGRGGPGGPGGPGRGMPELGGGRGSMESFLEAARAECATKAAGAACTANGTAGQCSAMFGAAPMCLPAGIGDMMARGGPGAGGVMRLTSRDPMYVPVTVTHDGRAWTQVGMRYKGNSSLMTFNAGENGKVPFRLDFNQYETETPAIRDQRFYGFKKLTFSSNFSDDSLLREVLATEILRDRGVPAARAAFYRVVVDTGSGPEYWGLYTMVEDPADGAMLNAQLGTSTGNLYKPEGPGANWSSFDPAGFEKKNNKSKADFTDVQSAIAALHAPRENPPAWRAALEAKFDVDRFLRWHAVNSVIENWDAYGAMAHNYYLYGDPAKGGRLTWIPWDHNLSFGARPGLGRGRGMPALPGGGGAMPGPAGGPGGPGRGGFPMMPGMGQTSADILAENVSDAWPLTKRLMADDVYAARYRAHLAAAMTGLLALPAFDKRARELHALIAPFVVGPNGERPTHTTISSADGFTASVDGPEGLLPRLAKRQAAVRAALAARGR